jgi:hypothetical protein
MVEHGRSSLTEGEQSRLWIGLSCDLLFTS